MRQDSEFFEGIELQLVYMARRLKDALRLENLLTEANVDYLVETGTYTAGLLMRRELTGAYFYVAPEQVDATRELMLRNRYKPYTGE